MASQMKTAAARPVAAPAAAQALSVVLQPIERPGLAVLRIDDELFAIGRCEEPFASYERDVVAEMSRRHARIFVEKGVAYVADLESKNGTSVNGVRVGGTPQCLRHGDELGFGSALRYRVALEARALPQHAVTRLLGLSLVPQRDDLGLETIVIASFPFLLGKGDERIARHREAHPQQVNYVSRRHAHIFLKGGAPYVEDLGSTNGTFVGERRLDEHAQRLHDGDVLAFGGRHFVYRVSLQEELVSEATLTRGPGAGEQAAPAAVDAEKTTFVAAPDSFLDIFCADPVAGAAETEVAEERDDTVDSRQRSRRAAVLAELAEAFGSTPAAFKRRLFGWAAVLVLATGAAVAAVHLHGAPERELARLMADGDYARAADLAQRRLAERPDDKELAALATEALLKAGVPDWLASLDAGDFERARAVLADMRARSGPGAEVDTLVGELEWITDLERFVAERGGVDAPIRIAIDEERITALLAHWRSDSRGHQDALSRIATQVPEFGDQYARTLSFLRKLESDDALYLAAIARLKADVDAQRARGEEAVDAVLREYAEKYPRLAGLDALRQRHAPPVAEEGSGR